jgi:hypothetical protein
MSDPTDPGFEGWTRHIQEWEQALIERHAHMFIPAPRRAKPLNFAEIYCAPEPWHVSFQSEIAQHVREVVNARDRLLAAQAAKGCAACGAPVAEMVVEQTPRHLGEKVTFVCTDHAPGDRTLSAWLTALEEWRP